MIRIIARPNPFEPELVYCDIEPGLSLTEIVGKKNKQVHIQVEGVPIPQEAWDDTYPVTGEVVTISVIPGLFGLEALIGIVAGAAQAGAAAGVAVGGALGLSTAATAVMGAVGATIGGAAAIAGMIAPMVMPFLIKPQMPSISGSGYTGGVSSRFNILNGNNNPTMQYGVIPKLYGEFRITPPVAGNSYTQLKKAVVVGQPGTYKYEGVEPTQVYHLLLCLGYGPLKIGGVCIGPESLGSAFNPETGQNMPFHSVAGTKSPTQPVDCLDQDALAILVGNTPIRSIPGALYTVGVAKEVTKVLNRVGWATYPADIEEDSLSLALPTINTPPDVDSSWTSIDGTYQVWTSSPNALKVEADITFNALYASRMKDDPNNPGLEDMNVDVVFRVLFKRSSAVGTVTRTKTGVDQWGAEQWVATTTGSWAQFTSFTATARAKHPCAWTVKIDLPSDNDPVGTTYDILIIRQHTSYPLPNVSTSAADASWIALRSIKGGNVWDTSDDTGLDEAVLMAVEFQATNGFNGSVDAISVRAKSVLKRPVVDNLSGWGSNQALKYVVSSSPAWAFADVFMGPQLQEPFKKDRVDWPALIEWANWCDGTTNKITEGPKKGEPKITDYNWYHVEEETILDRVRAITSCGRAAWNITGGLFTVVQDTKFYPVQLLSPRNSRNLEISKSYPKIPNAVRVRFVHPKTWQQDEVIVLDDYYLYRDGTQWKDNWGAVRTPGQNGYKKAKTFEVLETQGVTDKSQAAREGRYHIASMRLRPEFFTCEVDFENLVAQRGDCVLLSHDVLLRGWAFGRVLKINVPTQQSAEYRIDVDTDIEISPDLSFAVQVRSMNTDPSSAVPLAFIKLPLSNPPGIYTQLWVSSSYAGDIAKIAEGDLFVFGPLDTEGNPTGSLLAKITQIDYQPDMSARITMTYAAPGLPAADDGLIKDNGDGPSEKEIPPPAPTSFKLALSPTTPDLTPDGARFLVDAMWELPFTSFRNKVELVEVTYQIADAAWQVVQVNPTTGNTYQIKGVPPQTQVRGKARCLNSMGASDYTEESTLVTPSESELLPKMPTNLQLEQRDYRQGNGRILYFIQVSWTVEGLTGGTLIEWIKETDIAENGDWPADKKSSKFINGAGQFFEIEGVTVAIYHVRVASQGILRNDQYSAWNEGSLEILVYDYPPSPPTNLRATSTPSGVKLEWDNPLDSDWVGIEIWRNNANDREGRVEIPVIPPAKRIDKVPNNGADTGAYFDALDDSIWHWYWIRSYDSEDGIIATNWSSFEPLDPNGGVRGRAGIHGDGLPPPPPINLVLTPDTWEIGLHWEQSQEIPDLFGTQIYYSETNDRGPDEALLATYLATSETNFGTHTRLETGKTYYYWIRNIDVENPPQVSTWLPEDRYGGASATVPPDPWKYLELLNGAITETQLAQSLLGLINNQGLDTNQTFLSLQQLVSELAARVVLKIQQNYNGLAEVASIAFGSEVQNEQTVSQVLIRADRFAVGAPQVFNSAEIELSPIQYDQDGNLPVVYNLAGDPVTPYGYDGQPLPVHSEHAGVIRHVYDAEGNRMPIYTADHKIWPTPNWDGFVITTEEYIDSKGNFIPPGVYIRDANIATGSIHGRKIKAGTITADRIDTTGLVIKDAGGNEIFGANVELNLEKMFGQEAADIIKALKRHDIHLYIKNGVIGDLYIADTLSSIDYTPWSVDLNGDPIPGTGWSIQRGDLNQGIPSVIETDNLIARGELSSEIFYSGVQGWKLFKDGSCEFNNGVFRGTLGAETLLVGSDFSLGQLSEQIMLASLNIMVTNQYFTFTEAGADMGDETITMFANNLDNVLWTAKAYPGEVAVDLITPSGKPRHRQLTIDKMRNGTGFYDYIAVTAQFQDRFDQVKIFPLRDNSGIVTAELSNARINLAADSRGYVGNYTKAVGIFRAYLGKTVIAKSALAYTVLSTTNCTVSIINDPTKPNHGYYQVSEVTEQTASATIRVTYNGVHYDRLVEIFVYQAVLSGTPGEDGQDGADGKRGSKFFVAYSYDPGGYTEATWTEMTLDGTQNYVDAWVKAQPGAENVVVPWDVVTLVNYTTGWSQTRMYRQTGWEPISAFFNGDVLVEGTVYAKHIVANGITLSAGSSSTVKNTVNQTEEKILEDVAVLMMDDFESMHVLFNTAMMVPSLGKDTTVRIRLKVSTDGGATWTPITNQSYGVPGNDIPIMLSYSYNYSVTTGQAYVPGSNLRFRVTAQVTSTAPTYGTAVDLYDRSLLVLGTYR